MSSSAARSKLHECATCRSSLSPQRRCQNHRQNAIGICTPPRFALRSGPSFLFYISVVIFRLTFSGSLLSGTDICVVLAAGSATGMASASIIPGNRFLSKTHKSRGGNQTSRKIKSTDEVMLKTWQDDEEDDYHVSLANDKSHVTISSQTKAEKEATRHQATASDLVENKYNKFARGWPDDDDNDGMARSAWNVVDNSVAVNPEISVSSSEDSRIPRGEEYMKEEAMSAEEKKEMTAFERPHDNGDFVQNELDMVKDAVDDTDSIIQDERAYQNQDDKENAVKVSAREKEGTALERPDDDHDGNGLAAEMSNESEGVTAVASQIKSVDQVLEAEGEKYGAMPEWPDDDDDDDDDSVQSKNLENKVVADIRDKGKEGVLPEERLSLNIPQIKSADQVSLEENENASLEKQTHQRSNDSAQSKLAVESVTDSIIDSKMNKGSLEENVARPKIKHEDAFKPNSSSSNGGSRFEEPTKLAPESLKDDEGNTAVDVSNYILNDQTGDGMLKNNIDTEEDQSTDYDPENEGDGAGSINNVKDRLILPRSGTSSTAYHRNQSSEAVGEDQSADVEDKETGWGDDVEGEEMSQRNPKSNMGGEQFEHIPYEGDMTGRDADEMASGNSGNTVIGENPPPIEGLAPMEIIPNVVVTPPVAEQNVQPENIPNGNPNGNKDFPGVDVEEEDSFFGLVKSTFSVLFLAAFFTSILVFRKRVMLRMCADPSLGVPGAMKDEFVDVVMKLASSVANAARGLGATGGSGGAGGGTTASSTGHTKESSYGPETIPLSTATDEEWGWDNDDMGANLELSVIGRDEAKEDDDLAMAIAMSLSDAKNSVEDEDKGSSTPSIPQSNFTIPSLSAAKNSTKTAVIKNSPNRKMSSNSSSRSAISSFRDTGKIQRVSSTQQPKKATYEVPSQVTSETMPSSPAVGGNSIEDLLGQMGSAGGPVITSFGRKPKTQSNPAAVPKKDSSNDIFASMGLSSYPSKPATSGASSMPLALTPGGWQAHTAKAQTNVAAPKSAPLPSLLTDTFDDDADDWGDDGDLDDLLDD